MKATAVRFRSVDLLRLILILAIFICHVEYFKFKCQIQNVFDWFVNYHFADMAITGLFTISGFAITPQLLMNEGKFINIKFLKQRFLKTIPIYYVFILVGLYALPLIPAMNDFLVYPQGISFDEKQFILLGILPVVEYDYYNYSLLSHTWFIRVLIVFYLVWSILLRRDQPLKRILWVMFIAIGIKTIAYIFTDNSDPFLATNTWGIIYKFTYQFRIECFAMGSLIALFKHNYPIIITKYFTAKIYKIFILLTFPLFFLNISNVIYPNMLFSTLCGFTILFYTSIEDSNIVTSNSLKMFSNISYSFYLWQIPIIIFAVKYFSNTQSMIILQNIKIYVVALLSTIIISLFSHYYIERKINNTLNNVFLKKIG